MKTENTVWVYDEDTKAFKEYEASDPRLDYNEHAPEGRVRVYTQKTWRTSGKCVSHKYCPYGNTKQECVDNANLYNNRRIAKLQEAIDALKAQLVKA